MFFQAHFDFIRYFPTCFFVGTDQQYLRYASTCFNFEQGINEFFLSHNFISRDFNQDLLIYTLPVVMVESPNTSIKKLGFSTNYQALVVMLVSAEIFISAPILNPIGAYFSILIAFPHWRYLFTIFFLRHPLHFWGCFR